MVYSTLLSFFNIDSHCAFQGTLTIFSVEESDAGVYVCKGNQVENNIFIIGAQMIPEKV